jgi:hypothetical protein
MPPASGLRTSAFRYLLHTAVSLATHRAHAAEPDLLGHVNRPDACATADVEDAGRLPVLRDRGHGRLVQLVAPRHGEELVVDVHAVLLGLRGSACSAATRRGAHLIARVHVDASPEAVVQAAIFMVVAVLGGYGQTAGTG